MSVKRRMDRLIERSTDEEIAARMDKALAEWVYLSSYGASRGKTDGVHISTVTATADVERRAAGIRVSSQKSYTWDVSDFEQPESKPQDPLGRMVRSGLVQP